MGKTGNTEVNTVCPQSIFDQLHLQLYWFVEHSDVAGTVALQPRDHRTKPQSQPLNEWNQGPRRSRSRRNRHHTTPAAGSPQRKAPLQVPSLPLTACNSSAELTQSGHSCHWRCKQPLLRIHSPLEVSFKSCTTLCTGKCFTYSESTL